MDFHSLSRRELQSLCKLNKIPANITNVAMADALQSLEIVEGVEDILKVSDCERADLVEKAEVFSPKARTAIRVPKVKTTEVKTVARTTRRASKQVPSEVEEPKNDVLKTPAVSRTSKEAPATSSRRNVSNQLNECEMEEGLVGTRYSTRRLTRLVEKASDAPAITKGTENAVEIDSVLDAKPDEVPEETEVVQVEDICDAFEKLDVLVMNEEVENKSEDGAEDTSMILVPAAVKIAEEEVVDCLEISNLKQESHEEEVKNDLESDDIPSPCEDENLVENLDLGDSFGSEDVDIMCEEEQENLEQNLNIGEVTCDAVKENSFGMLKDEIVDSQIANISSLESGAADAELGQEDTLCEDIEMNNQVAETNSEETTMIEDLKTESLTEVKKDSAISDDKENIVTKEEKDVSIIDISIRQLKKQLKALTLKNLNNSKEDTTTTRPALKALSDNQMMVGAETQNKM